MKDIYEWEVLTPTGWQDFTGIVKFEKKVLTVKFSDGSHLTASETHRVLTMNGLCEFQNLVPGTMVHTKNNLVSVTEISKVKKKQNVFDLVEVANGHEYYTNGIISKNCDEIAFIPNRIQEEFMAGTAPALSATRGKMMITSTPNGSRDLFAKLWFNSGMEWDKKEYTYNRKNAPKNDFVPLFVPYWIDETKNNDEWISREKRTLDDITKWKVEFECLSEETMVEVYDEIEEEYKTITLSEMNRILLKDEIDAKVIIEE